MRKEGSTKRARNLRHNSTDAERLLWRHLRAKRINGVKFRRQEPLGKYIVDFMSYEKNIVIEIDGGQHATDQLRDHRRDEWLRAEGFKVIRFWNNDVLKNFEGVLEEIRKYC